MKYRLPGFEIAEETTEQSRFSTSHDIAAAGHVTAGPVELGQAVREIAWIRLSDDIFVEFGWKEEILPEESV